MERPPKGATDKEVLNFAICRQAPLLTRDQGDFVALDSEVNHYGIFIDKYMHLRNRTLVAKTIAGIVENYSESFRNRVCYLSNFYGQF